MATVSEGSELRHTTDGSTPTGASSLYQDPVPVLKTTTVKVRGFRTSWTDSDVLTVLFTLEPKGVGAGGQPRDRLDLQWDRVCMGIQRKRGAWRWDDDRPPESPAIVSSLTNVVAVATGAGHNLALTEDGSVFGWGDNLRGQLGDGTTTDRSPKPAGWRGLCEEPWSMRSENPKD